MGRLLALVVLAATAASCGGESAATPPTSTTTTTLPVPVSLSDSSPQGSYAGLGPVERVASPLLADGSSGPASGQSLAPYAANTATIAFRQFGSGPNLLLVMGQHGTMTWWDPLLLTDLAGHFRVTIFDLPGVGYSSPMSDPPTVESYADAAAGLIYSLHLTDLVVLGWGLGGAISLSLAERHRALVSRLVLVDATAGGPGSLATPKSVATVLDSPDATMVRLSRLIFPAADEAARGAWIDRVSQLSPDDIVASGISQEASAAAALQNDPSVARGLPGLKMPVLLISATDDSVVPAENSSRIAHLLSHREVIDVPSGGYAVLVEDEAALVNDLATFASSARGT
jgi:pimeloyl-ACP methyl ester carboxylesterase